MTFGSRLKKARENKGYKQNQFADMLGVTATRLNYWEKDKREPDVEMIKTISYLLEVSSDWLIGNTEHIKKDSLSLTGHEKRVIIAYRNKPEMQPAVDKLLGVEENENFVVLPSVARSDNNRPAGTIRISKEKLEQLRNAESVENEEDL